MVSKGSFALGFLVGVFVILLIEMVLWGIETPCVDIQNRYLEQIRYPNVPPSGGPVTESEMEWFYANCDGGP